ncbi:MAG: TonB-dependent receptor [Saprospiraceae bacterium]|nr:TonB-dependent receptor [Saprospiraceae bacterium]
MKHLSTWLVALCVIGATSLSGQITTATLTGLITDAKGEGMPGVTVTAQHTPSGTGYGVTTRPDGRYSLPNLRVGGPFLVKAAITGFQSQEVTIPVLQLGEKRTLNFQLAESSTQLGQAEVVSQSNTRANGAGASVSSEQLRTLPTITRSSADFTRLVPMSADGGSFGGRNDQFNNYSLDGTIFNNPFGLDAATPGGQADAQPISLDAIDQINVAIAPFDVTQAGFTGAAINAVTKSGTNNFSGTVFAFYRNKDMIGAKVRDQEVFRGDLRQLQTGFSFGGPIIRDKLFFFVNLEVERRSDLGSNFIANRGTGASNESRVLASDLDLVSDLLSQRYGYETGPYENYKHNTDNQKGLVKIDWNINSVHKLTITGNFLDAFREKPAHPSAIGRRGPDATTLQFYNSGYRINNKLYSGIAELKSIFGNKFANKFQAGFSSFRDSRDPFSAPFPVVNIAQDGDRYIIAGHEPFSIHNVLDQNVYQVNDNFNIYTGKHNITLGGSLERFDFNNSFNLTGYGFRVFDIPGVDIDTFAQWINAGGLDAEVQGARDAFANNNANNKWGLAETNLGQFALYAQDEWALSPKFNLTVGLRMDMPLYFDTKTKIEENIARKGGLLADGGTYAPDIEYYDEDGKPVKFDHTVLPKKTPLISPRIGFNYDFKGDRSRILRGGSGLFTGRFPFVWIGNQVANPDFFFYCVTDPDFKFPQVWRTNIGYDHKLGNGWTATVDLLYTKNINDMMVRNFGLKKPTGRLTGADDRPIYLPSDRALVFGGPTNAYVFTNVNKGHEFNASFQVTKNWADGSSLMLGYNFLDAKDVASIDAEISSDAYDRNPANIQHTNTPQLAPSLYGNKHRFVGSFSKHFHYGSFGTTISLFSEYVQGGRFSYTYAGDLNNDGSGLNDLLYIPTDAEINQMNFTGDAEAQQRQRDGLRWYIAQDEYLRNNRGQYAEKYAALSPWYSRWDMRILQDYNLPNKNVIQLSIDILNVGNLLNSDWGVRQYATYTGLVQPLAVSVANSVPTYTFDTTPRTTFSNDFSLASRWQLQVGLRYSF